MTAANLGLIFKVSLVHVPLKKLHFEEISINSTFTVCSVRSLVHVVAILFNS